MAAFDFAEFAESFIAWMLVCFGVRQMFNKAGARMSDGLCGSVRAWILDEPDRHLDGVGAVEPARPRWLQTFTGVYDTVFVLPCYQPTARQICDGALPQPDIGRSTAFYLIAVSLLTIVFLLRASLPTPARTFGSVGHVILSVPTVMWPILLATFASVAQTRCVLSGALSAGSRRAARLWLVLDVPLKFLIVYLAAYVSQLLFSRDRFNIFSIEGPVETSELVARGLLLDSNFEVTSIFVYVLLLPTIWMWLYGLGGWLLRQALSAPTLRPFLSNILKVGTRPLAAMGNIIILVILLIFAVHTLPTHLPG